MGKPFTPQRLAAIRRMRKARRLYKKQPLFAYDMLRTEYPGYTYDQFRDDLRYRRKPKRRKGKTPLARYGRYWRMQQLTAQYSSTGNIVYGLQAQRLRKYMTKPYRVKVRIGREVLEYRFSPLIRIEAIEQLTAALPQCSTPAEADTLVEQFSRTAHIS